MCFPPLSELSISLVYRMETTLYKTEDTRVCLSWLLGDTHHPLLFSPSRRRQNSVCLCPESSLSRSVIVTVPILLVSAYLSCSSLYYLLSKQRAVVMQPSM